MPQGKLLADGSTENITPNNGEITLSLKGTWGGGTVTIEKRTNNTFYPATDINGADLAYTADQDVHLSIGGGDVIRLTLSGATAPDIDWQTSDYSR